MKGYNFLGASEGGREVATIDHTNIAKTANITRQSEHRAEGQFVPTAPSVKISRPIETSITPTGTSHRSNGNIRRPGTGIHRYQREHRARGSSVPTATKIAPTGTSIAPTGSSHRSNGNIGPPGTSCQREHRANGNKNIAPTGTSIMPTGTSHYSNGNITPCQRKHTIAPTGTSHRSIRNIPLRQQKHVNANENMPSSMFANASIKPIQMGNMGSLQRGAKRRPNENAR